MSISDLITYLKKAIIENGSDLVVASGWEFATSSRARYEDLGLSPRSFVTLGAMLKVVMDSKGKTFEGWKGGCFTMNAFSETHLARQNEAGEPITRLWLDAEIALAKILDAQAIAIVRSEK